MSVSPDSHATGPDPSRPTRRPAADEPRVTYWIRVGRLSLPRPGSSGPAFAGLEAPRRPLPLTGPCGEPLGVRPPRRRRR